MQQPAYLQFTLFPVDKQQAVTFLHQLTMIGIVLASKLAKFIHFRQWAQEVFTLMKCICGCATLME